MNKWCFSSVVSERDEFANFGWRIIRKTKGSRDGQEMQHNERNDKRPLGWNQLYLDNGYLLFVDLEKPRQYDKLSNLGTSSKIPTCYD